MVAEYLKNAVVNDLLIKIVEEVLRKQG